MENKTEKMSRLVARLNEASRAYYQGSAEIMSNLEYDALYDELVDLERETGIVLSSSPTVNVGYEVLSELPKERHASPMLSLDKTKDREVLKARIGDRRTLLSWKMDGLTVVLTYDGGELQKAVTRGNGEVGEVITANARCFKNIPLKIPFEGELVVRGEAVIGYGEFERINSEIPETEARYKNPRNLCSGSVRQLDSGITAKRGVHFFAFALVGADGVDFENSHEKEFLWLGGQGFDVVEYKVVTAADVDAAVDWFAGRIGENEYPSDGLVALFDDIEYGRSLGRTAKFPRDSFAFKWADERARTVLREIEWSPSRTGLINPVAVFEPVELEGTTVSRASVHNISIMEELELGVGDTIEVYKANMIIPQIAANLTRSGVRDIPKTCPVCGGATSVRQVNDAKSLYCTNPGCEAKKIKSFALMASRDALNIEGLSEATLEKFIGKGFIHEYADIFRLGRYRDQIVLMEGFGGKSYDNLMSSLAKARKTSPARVIYSLGIPNVGLSGAKLICREFDDDIEKVINASEEDLSAIDGVGPVIAGSFVSYFADEDNRRRFMSLLSELELEKSGYGAGQDLKGKTFVITGSLKTFANRGELKELIESRGGKVTGSVSKKTDFLINNDATSTSTKNKKAAEFGVKVITEDDFLKM